VSATTHACECARVNACVHDTKSVFQSTRGGWRTDHTPHCSPHTKASAHRCLRVDSMEGVRACACSPFTAQWTRQSATPMMATATPQPHYQHHQQQQQQQQHGRSSRGPRGERAPRRDTIARVVGREGGEPRFEMKKKDQLFQDLVQPWQSAAHGLVGRGGARFMVCDAITHALSSSSSPALDAAPAA
jgi:hypothetical protein